MFYTRKMSSASRVIRFAMERRKKFSIVYLVSCLLFPALLLIHSVQAEATEPSFIKVKALPHHDKSTIEVSKTKSAPTDEPALYLEMIVDVSGSMAGKLDGKSKMYWAKEALLNSLNQLQERDVAVALRAYGFDHSVAKTAAASCPNTKLIEPFGKHFKQRISRSVTSLLPYGYTPIAESLRQAGMDLAPHKDKHPHLILFSDGEETCGGDAIAVIKKLHADGIMVRVHVIGFDLNRQQRSELEAIAKAGDGLYFDADSSGALAEQFEAVLNEINAVVQQVAPERFTNPVRGGESIESAVALKPGSYTLTEDIPKKGRQYFYVATQKSELGRISSNIQTYAVSLKQGKAKRDAGFSIHIHRPDGSLIKGRSALVRKVRDSDLTTGYMDREGQGFYFAVGDNYVATHKDASFRLTVDQAGDLYESWEMAKDSTDAAAPNLNEAFAAHLGLEDKTDSYMIHATSSPAILKIKFSDPEFRFKVIVIDQASGRRIAKHVKLTGEAVITLPASTDGLSFSIHDANPTLYNMFSSYIFTLEANQ